MTTPEWTIAARTGDRLGESVLWHPRERAVYWVDWYGAVVHRLGAGKVEPESWTVPGSTTIGSLAFSADGRLLLALETGLKLFDTATGQCEDFADPNQGRPGVGYNDGKVDRFNRFWFGTFDAAEAEPRGILYCVDGGGRATVADSGFIVCNGPAFSPDGRTLYFSDTIGRRILAYDMSPNSPRLENPRVLATMSEDEGMPDGLAVDAAGAVWCAHYGGGRITRYDPAGEAKAVYRLPCPNVTSCCLGGETLSTLFVTTGLSPGVSRAEDEPAQGGALFALEVDATGLAEPEFSSLRG